jgi:acylphosphatase
MKHLEVSIFGDVQGVGYRYFALYKARELGISGFVKNMMDGSVKVVCEGEDKILNEFLDDLKKGPYSAKVSRTEVYFSDDIKGYSTFEVRF